MAFATNYRRAGVALLAIAVTAALFWFGKGLNPYWPLLWFAPIPVLLSASRTALAECSGDRVSRVVLRQLQFLAVFSAAWNAACAGCVQFCFRGGCLHAGGPAVSSAASPGSALERPFRFSSRMGDLRMGSELRPSAWHGRQFGVHAVELPTILAACICDWSVGHELFAAAVSGCGCNRPASAPR